MRNVIGLLDFDFGYSYCIFAYGGFMGLMIGIILNFKYKGERTTAKSYWYVGSAFSGALSLFGAVVLFCMFPILAMDPSYEFFRFGTHMLYVIPQSVWYAISASTIVSMAGSVLAHGNPIGRDVINGIVAGGVSSLTASFYFTNPVWSMILGSASGILQLLGQSLVETKWAKKNSIINTYSFTVFGAQALLGGVFAAIFRAVVTIEIRRHEFTYEFGTVTDVA